MNNKINEVRRFYETESQCYLSERYNGETCEHVSYLTRKRMTLGFLKDAKGTILDVGCGPGIFTRELVNFGLIPYSADLSMEMVKKARSVCRSEDQAFWCCCEIERLPFSDEAFDNVLAIGVIGYAVHPLKAIQELSRVLRVGGMLVVQCSNSLAPTPKVEKIKMDLGCLVGLRRKRWAFKLVSFPYRRLRESLEIHKLKVEEKRSYDFRLPFIEKLSAPMAVDIMNNLQKHFEDSKVFSHLGEGYVIKARKTQ